THQRLVCTQQKLLSCLPARIKCAGNLGATKRAIRKHAAIFARKWHTLRNALIDDVYANLRKAINICFTRAVVTAFDGVIKESINAVSIVLIILCRVNSTLRGNAMRASRTVLVTKTLYVVSKFRKLCSGSASGQAGSNHDDVVLALICGIHQLH